MLRATVSGWHLTLAERSLKGGKPLIVLRGVNGDDDLPNSSFSTNISSTGR